MRRLGATVLGAVAATLLGGGWMLIRRSAPAPLMSKQPATGMSDSSAASAPRDDWTTNRLLIAQLDQLNARLATIESRSTQATSSAEGGTSKPSSEAPAEPSPPTAPAERFARNQIREANLDGAFRAETTDLAWAATAKAALLDRFDRAALTGTSLIGTVECAATMCRVLARHDSAQARDQFEETAMGDRMGTLTLSRDRRDAPNRPPDANAQL